MVRFNLNGILFINLLLWGKGGGIGYLPEKGDSKFSSVLKCPSTQQFSSNYKLKQEHLSFGQRFFSISLPFFYLNVLIHNTAE